MVLPTDNMKPEVESGAGVQKPELNKSVVNILNSLKSSTNNGSLTNAKKKNVKKDQVPRGLPKSGRPWKEPKQKFSKIKKTIYRRSPHKKEEFRNELKHIKALSKSIKEDKKQENEEKRKRREVNAKRKLENERKSEVVQVIKNPAKIKRMKKKALRKIEKRDLDTLKVV